MKIAIVNNSRKFAQYGMKIKGELEKLGAEATVLFSSIRCDFFSPQWAQVDFRIISSTCLVRIPHHPMSFLFSAFTK
ncbi:MAG: hypothetical protein ACTSRW_12690 [Candidatus Helarchaeota archaeon]